MMIASHPKGVLAVLTELRPLSPDDGRDVYDMLQEIPEDENGFINHFHGIPFDEYRVRLAAAYAESKQVGIVDGWKVPQTIFWFYADGKPAGMCKLRHFLTEQLLLSGGHIGYAIRPSMRGMGLGTKQLKLVLNEAKRLGIDRVLVTTNPDNVISQRVILACGGKPEHLSPDKCRFWIHL